MDGIKEYRNIYQGQRAWIIGNGPSLDQTPLDRLIGEYCFGINRIGQKFNVTEWRPQFYICSTGYASEAEYQADVIKALKCSDRTFINNELKPILGDKIPLDHSYKVSWLDYLHATSKDRYKEPRFEWWNPLTIEQNVVSNFGTSAFACSQILAYMGFNPIYLVGCDLGYKSFVQGQPDPNHFGDNYESGVFQRPQAIHNIDNLRYVQSHKIMKRQAKRMGINIYNATLGGELEAYGRMDFFDVA